LVYNRAVGARFAILIALLAAAPAVAEPYSSTDEQAAIAWLEARCGKVDYDSLYREIQPTIANESRPQLIWRLARVIINKYEVDRVASDKEKLRAYEEVERLSRLCIKQQPEQVPYCHLFLGVALGRQGTVRGVISSLRSAKEVERTWLRGLELSRGRGLKLSDETLESQFAYLLGIYYRIVPDSWWVKLLAGTRGDKQKSIDFHRQSIATRLKPDLSCKLELAVSLLCKSPKQDEPEHAEGIRWLDQVIASTPTDKFDVIDRDNARKVKANPKVACGYSRDKIQNMSEDQIKK
jgi:hypothetical protein